MGFLRNLFGSGMETSQPKFVVKRQTPSGVYEVYKGGNAESAKAFLATKKVDKPQYYIKVETSEGNWGIDIDGLYLEQLVSFQLNINSAQCDGSICGMPAPSGLKYAANGVSDNFVVKIKCGKCNHEWNDGVRYKNVTIVKCSSCGTFNKVDSRPHIVESGGILAFKVNIE
jgi:ribosomal protein S27E